MGVNMIWLTNFKNSVSGHIEIAHFRHFGNQVWLYLWNQWPDLDNLGVKYNVLGHAESLEMSFDVIGWAKSKMAANRHIEKLNLSTI
jgi:hypothetical protein